MTESEPTPLPPEHVTIDGIEGKYARIELPDGMTADWLLSTLPEGVKEGDVLVISEEGDRIELDHAETKKRQDTAQSKLEALNHNAPSGAIDL